MKSDDLFFNTASAKKSCTTIAIEQVINPFNERAVQDRMVECEAFVWLGINEKTKDFLKEAIYYCYSRTQKILMPLIRRVLPSLIASDIMGVQPMTGPTGNIFKLKTRYTKTASP